MTSYLQSLHVVLRDLDPDVLTIVGVDTILREWFPIVGTPSGTVTADMRVKEIRLYNMLSTTAVRLTPSNRDGNALATLRNAGTLADPGRIGYRYGHVQVGQVWPINTTLDTSSLGATVCTCSGSEVHFFVDLRFEAYSA